jgi:flagellin-like protein
MRKGISPFVSTVLLVAFAIAVAVIFGGWISTFTQTTTKDVQEKSEKRVTCSYGGIALENLKYNKTTGNFSGKVENTDIIVLGNIDFEIFYTDDTREKLDLNMTLESGEKNTFTQSVSKMNSSNTSINKIRVITNCSNVYDEATSNDVPSNY